MATKIPARASLVRGLIPTRARRAAVSTSFQKGRKRTGGRPPGTPNKLTQLKQAIIATSGMTALEFLTFVFRDQLYEEYVEDFAKDGKTIIYHPAKGAKKVPVTLNQRVTCALGAAPYMHKKMPVGIEVKDKNAALISTDKLRDMSDEDLEKLLTFMDRFGLSMEVASARMVEGPSG